jgi:hypothetical protein
VPVFPLVIASPAPMLDVHGFGGGSAAKIVVAMNVRKERESESFHGAAREAKVEPVCGIYLSRNLK